MIEEVRYSKEDKYNPSLAYNPTIDYAMPIYKRKDGCWRLDFYQKVKCGQKQDRWVGWIQDKKKDFLQIESWLINE
jgi:hypothetical protein